MPPRHRQQATGPTRPSAWLVRGAVVLAVVVGLVVVGVRIVRRDSSKGGSPPATGAHTSTTLGVVPATFTVAPSSLIATLHAATPSYASATAPTATGSVLPTWSGATLGLPVVAIEHGRCQIRLLQRPNGATAWVDKSAVSLTHTTYHVYVDLAAERLLLFKRSKLVLQAPAVVGSPQYPTPTGHFFVALFAQAPSPAYGPFVIVTSAFADTVTDWEQEGDGMVAVSGPIDAAAAIQAGGGRLSHGGVRIADSAMARLRAIPAGTPIDVVATLARPHRRARRHAAAVAG